MIYNPWPLWLTAPHIGGEMFGVPMPSVESVLSSFACVNLWPGYDRFPRDHILQLLASKLGITVSSPGVVASSSSSDLPQEPEPEIPLSDMAIPKLGAWASAVDMEERKKLSKALTKH